MALIIIGIVLLPSFVMMIVNGGEIHNLHTLTAFLQGTFDIFSIPVAHAQGANFGTTASKFFGTMLEIFTVLNWVLLGMVQAVMNPDIIFGNAVGGVRPMEVILRQIWMLSRDIVNAIFAFLLIIGAIMMIVKGKMEVIKQHAPQFVIAVVLVNFSWFLPRVILDVANVLQAVIYQIPAMAHGSSSSRNKCIESMEDTDGNPANGYEKIIPCKYVWSVRLFPPTPAKCADANPPAGCPRPEEDPGAFPNWGHQYGQIVDVYYADWNKVMKSNGVRISSGRFIPASGADVVMNGLAVNMAKMPNLSRLDLQRAQRLANQRRGMLGQAQDYMQFFMYLVFNAVLSMAIGLLLLAMLAVFIVRIGVIWLCVAFMPFIFIGYAMKGALGDMGIESFPNIKTYFIKYAFLPAMVAVPLSVGFTLLGFAPAIANWSGTESFIIHGLSGVSGIGTLHELIWLALTLGIIWTGTFKVLKSGDDIASGFVGSVEGFGKGAMKTGMNFAGYAPVIPMPGGGDKKGLFHFRNMARNASYGDPRNSLDFGNMNAPQSNKIEDTVDRASKTNELKNGLRELNSKDPADTKAINDTLKKIVTALEKAGMSRTEAINVVTNKDTFKKVVNESEKQGVISNADAVKLKTNFDLHVNNIDTALDSLGLSVKAGLNQSEVGTKVSNALRTTTISIPDLEKHLATGRDAQFEAGSITAFQEIIDKVNQVKAANQGGLNNADFADEMDKL